MSKQKQQHCYMIWHKRFGAIPSSARMLRRDCIDDWCKKNTISQKGMKVIGYRCVKTTLIPETK